MLKQQRAIRTRRTVLDAAARVFAANGYLATSLSQILAEAGVTKGALYFHFASKEELARALVLEQSAPTAPELPGGAPALQAAIDLTHRIARSLVDDPKMQASIRLVIEQGVFMDEPDAGPYLGWISLLQELFTEAQRVGDIRAESDPATLARTVVGSFTGIQLVSGVLEGRSELPERVGDLWELVLPGLVPPRRRARFRARPQPEALAQPATAALSH